MDMSNYFVMKTQQNSPSTHLEEHDEGISKWRGYNLFAVERCDPLHRIYPNTSRAPCTEKQSWAAAVLYTIHLQG